MISHFKHHDRACIVESLLVVKAAQSRDDQTMFIMAKEITKLSTVQFNSVQLVFGRMLNKTKKKKRLTDRNRNQSSIFSTFAKFTKDDC